MVGENEINEFLRLIDSFPNFSDVAIMITRALVFCGYSYNTNGLVLTFNLRCVIFPLYTHAYIGFIGFTRDTRRRLSLLNFPVAFFRAYSTYRTDGYRARCVNRLRNRGASCGLAVGTINKHVETKNTPRHQKD